MKVLITGAAGFIGHHLVDHILNTTTWNITIIDRLDCSGNLNRLAEIGAAKNPRVKFVFHDLRAGLNDQLCAQIGYHPYIVHMAAATHVDRSISNPMEFVLDNVVATCNMLDFARKVGCIRFINFSTDEVFGAAPAGVAYAEDARYMAGNPYAATKAGAAQLGVAYRNTYGVPVVTTHTMNVIGVRQHPEKFVPMTIAKVMAGDKVLIHSDKTKSYAGSRYYINAKAVADAVMFILLSQLDEAAYNIVGRSEVNNLQMANRIAECLGKPLNYEMIDFHSSRPGHDLRYALDGSRLAAAGWVPSSDWQNDVKEIVDWTVINQQWLIS